MPLYDQFGREIPPTKKPESRPFAAATITDSFREYVADGLTPERLAVMFKEADAGDLRRQAELFDQIEEKDTHILGEAGKRKNVILDVEWEMLPASEDPRDKKIAEEAETFLQSIEDWDDTVVCLQDAVGKGYAGLELIWDASEGQATVQDFKFIETGRFNFVDTNGILSRVPRLITDDDAMGIEIPAWKVMFHQYGGKSAHPTRSGIHRVCSWMFLFKNYSIKDWVIFCEVYGMPLRIGKYNPGSSPEDKAALELAVRTLGTDAAGVISSDTEIEFVTGNKGSVSSDLYEGLAKFCNKEISKALLGQTLTADVGDSGSYAASKTHNDVRLDLLRADARAIAATVRNQLLRPWVGFNYGWDAPVPRYQAYFKEPEELDALSLLIDRLADRIDIPVSWVREKFSIPAPEKDEPVLIQRQLNRPISARQGFLGSMVAKSPSVPETMGFSPVQGFLERLEREADPYVQDMVNQVRHRLTAARNITEFREALFDAGFDLNAGALGELFQEAMTAAEMAGRMDITTEAEEG